MSAFASLVTKQVNLSRRKRTIIVTATLNAGSYVPGGLTLDWTTVTNPKLLSAGKPMSNPKLALVLNTPAGYPSEIILGATMQTSLLKISTSPGVEMTAVALPAALVADPFLFEIEGPIGSF